MKHVYIVSVGVDYEGSYIHGVYATMEEGVAKVEETIALWYDPPGSWKHIQCNEITNGWRWEDQHMEVSRWDVK